VGLAGLTAGRVTTPDLGASDHRPLVVEFDATDERPTFPPP
jgi:endonuclease/exonuclease/phosphatase (EEP) superfamily protein YafD